jgi:hypothetical protein
MPRSNRFPIVAFLGVVGSLATAAPAPAQYMGGGPMYGYRFSGRPANFRVLPPGVFNGLPPVGMLSPLPGVNGFNPLMFSPFNRNYNPSYNYAAQYYYFNRLSYGSSYAPSYSPSYGSSPSSGGYMTGGVRNSAVDSSYRDYARAQQQSSTLPTAPAATGARNAIYDQWVYEKLGVKTVPGIKPGEDNTATLNKALSATDEAELASGELLNQLLVATVAAEGKGAKADSAFLPPNLIAEVRFSGPAAADALNLLRRGGKLDFPAAFDGLGIAPMRPVLEREFAAAVAPVLVGKAVDPVKVSKLEATLKQVRETISPRIKDLDFEDATAVRRFLNQLDAAVKALKGSGTAGLVDPKWATEGTSVAGLIKHMTKNKLLFGQVERGNEDAYVALHRGLAAYLMALNGGQKAPKQ